MVAHTLSFWQKIGRIFTKPTEFWSDIAHENEFAPALWYYLGVNALGGGVTLVFASLNRHIYAQPVLRALSVFTHQQNPVILGNHNAIQLIVSLVFALVSYLLFTLVFTLFTQLVLRLFKAQGSYADTFIVYAYAATPRSLLGTIPVVGWLAAFFGIVLAVLGLSKRHSVTPQAAFGSYFLAWLAIVVIAVLIFILAIIAAAIVLTALKDGAGTAAFPQAIQSL